MLTSEQEQAKEVIDIKKREIENMEIHGVSEFVPDIGQKCKAARINLHHSPRGVMVKAMNCGIVVRGFVLQSRYYVPFRANTLGKGMNPLILPPAMGK